MLLLPLSEDIDPKFLDYRNGKKFPGLGYDLHVTTKIPDHPTPNGPTLRLEFNPSRVIDPTGSTLASADEAAMVSRMVLDTLDQVGCAHGGQRDEDVQIIRCDIARDFGVADPAAWVDALRGVRASYAREQHGYFDADGELTGIQSGCRKIAFKIYDKTGVHAADVWRDQNNLRFEVQLTGKARCAKNGVGDLSRLTDGCFARVGRNLWTRSRYDRARLFDDPATIIAQTDHDSVHKAAMLGQYVSLQKGIPLGVAAGHSVHADLWACGLISRKRRPRPLTTGRRLDWVSGTEVQA